MKNTANDLHDISQVVLEHLCEYINTSQQGKDKVLKQPPPEVIARSLNIKHYIQQGGIHREGTHDFMKYYLEYSQHLHHPKYLGHQVPGPHIASGIADFIHGVINNPMSIYEMGPSAAVIERVVIHWMLDKIGWFKGTDLTDFSHIPGNGGGFLTHGGSLANLTALLAARAAVAPDAWTEGTPSDLVVLVPEESHYSVARSIAIMGLGHQAIVPVKTNNLKVLQPEYLQPVYRQVLKEGKRVMAVVANACTTATGLYDPLDEIGQFCQENGLWLHVDGAHGASALISEKERILLKGVERADSLIWDAHKMLRTSALAAAVLFRDRKPMETIFRQKGSYLFHEKEEIGFDTMPYTLECTKAGIGTKLFWVLAAEGEKGLAGYVEHVHKQTADFYGLIVNTPDFNCPYTPESNILCFQYTKYGTDNAFQLAIRNELVKRGNYYITSTELNGIRYLRIVVLSDLTEKKHIESLLAEVEIVAEDLYEKRERDSNF